MHHRLHLLILPLLVFLLTGIARAQVTSGRSGSGSAVPSDTTALTPESSTSFIAEESQLMHARLWRWRNKFKIDQTGDLGLFGDSMLAGPEVVAEMRPLAQKLFGFAGYCFLEPFESGGAVKYLGPSAIFTHWFNGTIVRLTGSGHVATVNVDNNGAVEANTLKLYYVKKSGGGIFKVQTRMNGGTWTDEPGYLNVDTNAATNGGVITLTKTNLRAVWDIRAVWVSGGQVDIIGGALYDTRIKGIRYGNFSSGSTTLSSGVSAPTIVTNAIMGDIGIDLAFLSYLDSPSDVLSYQAPFQQMIDTASGAAPSWVVIGPPVGPNNTDDAIRKAETKNMKTIADTRRDAFWDNRRWAGTPAQAVAQGLHSGTSDPHYENLAAANWVPRMFEALGLAETRVSNNGVAGSVRLFGTAEIRRDEIVDGGTRDLAVIGNLSVGPRPGEAGSGYVKAYDTDGPTWNNDWMGFAYTNNIGYVITGAVPRWSIEAGNGRGPSWYHPASTATTPQGLLGTPTCPVLEVNLGKTITPGGTTGTQTIHKTSGRVNFAASASSVTVNCDRATTGSVIIATVATNDSTMKSVQVVAGTGSFTLHANATPTAETAVNWWLIP
jgi:hypothetical protein